jgi:hypothetical protein
MCQKLGWQPIYDFQKVDKILTRQIEFIRGYARFTLEHFPLLKIDLDDQNLLLATVSS